MNKAQLLDAMAEKAGLSKADAKKALDAFIDATSGALKKGGRVALVGFGSFSVSERAARDGRNPQTGETLKIKARNGVKFYSAGKLLRVARKGFIECYVAGRDHNNGPAQITLNMGGGPTWT